MSGRNQDKIQLVLFSVEDDHSNFLVQQHINLQYDDLFAYLSWLQDVPQ